MSRFDADVLVVGGGPAGAATAIVLARQGVDVLILEKARFPREKACAEFYSPGAVTALDRLGVLAAAERRSPAHPTGMRVSTDRAAFTLSYLPRHAFGLPRPDLDVALLARARELGARIEEGSRVLGCIVENGRARGVRLQTRSGDVDLRAPVVVGADGFHSVVSRSLGVRIRSPGPPRLGLVARYDGVDLGNLGRMHVGPGRYCGVAPVGPGLANVGLVVPWGENRSGESIDAFFNRSLKGVPGVTTTLRDGRRITPIRGMGPLSRRPDRIAGPGFLLVGDAAGFDDPFTGEGVYHALRGGEIAAAAILEGLDPDETPASYRRRRHAAFAAKARLSSLVQLFLRSYRLFEYVTLNLSRRSALASQLAAALGDVAPADPLLRLGFILSVLRP